MINLEKNINYKKKYNFFLFDFDGVLFNSKKNMELSWSGVLNNFDIKIKFSNYYKQIGKPFYIILKNLGVKKELHRSIYKTFKKKSLENIDIIKPYKGLKDILKTIKKNPKNKIGIVTSKDLYRVKKICSRYRIKFDFISGSRDNIRGKPYPDQILFTLKKLNIKKKDFNKVIFIGDTLIDLIASNRAKIDYVFSQYGYGDKKEILKKLKSKKKNYFTIDKLKSLQKIVG